MRDPLHKSRPVAAFSARFGGCRINDFVLMSEGNSNSHLLETSEGNILINAGMSYEAPVHHANFAQAGNREQQQLVYRYFVRIDCDPGCHTLCPR